MPAGNDEATKKRKRKKKERKEKTNHGEIVAKSRRETRRGQSFFKPVIHPRAREKRRETGDNGRVEFPAAEINWSRGFRAALNSKSRVRRGVDGRKERKESKRSAKTRQRGEGGGDVRTKLTLMP